MEKIFLAPISLKNYSENYKKSVVDGISRNTFFQIYDKEEYLNQLQNAQRIHLWGVKNTKITPFRKCSVNDFLLYYYQGTIISYCRVILKLQNRQLSEKIWGKDLNKITKEFEYWENLLFLTVPIKISLDFKILIDFANYNPKASVRGFNEYSPVGLAIIINKYKTIENFLNKYNI